jgi:hypothetical protein
MQLQNDAATLLTNAFTLLNGGLLSVAQAETGAAAATNTLLDSFKQNGHAIDGNTKAAVANQQAVEQKIAADQQSAEAIAKQTGSTQAGTKSFADSKLALENQLRATHNLTPAIQAYIDKLYAIPPVAKTKMEIDSAAAAAKIAAFKASLAAINRSITVRVNAIVSNAATNPNGMGLGSGGNQTQKKAGGGFVSYLAGGGSPFEPQGTDTVPAMLTPHEFVVRAAAASYNPAFLKAYNDNPRKALADVQAPSVTHQHTWNLYGIQDPAQLSQQMAARMNARAV